MTAPDVRAQAADLIDQAIDVLHERGWIKGDYEADQGVCAAGAVYVAADARGGDIRVLTAIAALNDQVGDSIATYNDLTAKSVEDIQLVMKRAAESLREPQP